MADFTPKDSPINTNWTSNPSINLPKDSPVNTNWSTKNTPKEIPISGYNFQNIDRYKRFIDEIYPNVDLERQAAANQSGFGKFGNMVAQGIVGEILNQGVIGGAGSIIGMPGAIYNGIAGKDADFNNFLTRFADNISEELQNKAPIFRYNPGKAFDWKDWGWWTSNGVSIFSTLGMMLPVLGEAKIAGYIGKAIKSVAEVSKLNKIRVADKALGAVSDIFDTEKYWQKLAHSSITMRNAENFREASQVYNDIRSEAFESFKNDEEYNKILNSEIGQEYLSQNGEPSKIGLANFIASQASWRNYSINAANVFFDAMQLAPIFKGFKIKTTENLVFTPSAIKNIQANILKTGEKFSAINAASFLKGSSLVIGEQLSEGAEELVNAIGQSEGSWYGKHLIGKEKDSNWGDRVSEYLHDPSAWEQAFWGFAGGMAFSAAARGVKNLQEAIYDIKDPHSISARQEEIINRYKLLGGVSDLLKKTMDGLNPYTSEKFKGSSEQIKDQQIETIKHLKKDMGYTLGLNAARSGNFTLLLNMLEHNNFKEEMIKLGIADEATFSEIHTNLLKDVKDAEKTYRDVYGKIFEGTTKKPWLREVILGNAVKTKGLIERFREGRDKYLNKLNDLKATNPAYASLIEKNKDKDLEGSIENIVYDNVISILEGQIKESKDEATKEVATTRLAQFKTELLSRKKELKDKEVTEGLNAISDIIETQIEVALYDTFLQEQNVAYENIVNTEKSIPLVENKIKLATEETHRVQYETFKVKINELSKIDNTNSVEDIDKKIAELDSIITSLEDSKNDPYVTEDKPTKKLSSTWLKNYIESVKNRKLYLIQEKNRRGTIESQLKDREVKNTTLVTRAQSLFKELGIKAEAKFTGKRSPDFNKTLESQLTTFISDKSQITFYPLLIDMISDTTQKVSDLSPEVQGAFTNVMNSTINALLEKNLTEEFINEILVLAGYITESELPSINTTELTKKADEFREAVENKNDIKAVLNFSTQNPLKKELVDFANAWITDIINRTSEPGESPLFIEHEPDGTKPVKGTNIYFAPIAAKYGKLVGAERLIQDFDLLKLAYTIIRNSKVNPETGAKRNYNNDKTLKGITVEKIIATHNITSDFKDYEFYNNSLLSDTGGTGVANIYLPGINFNYEKDKDGNFIISDKERERFELLSSSLNENSEVTLSINTGLSGEKGFSLNKNNSDTIPIKVTTNIGGKEIFIGAINTIPTNHKGIKYNFKGEDWTDILLRDARNTNSNFDALERIYPALRNWYNNQKMQIEEQEIDSDLDAIAEADTFSLLPKLLGGLDMFSDEGRAALLHISKILFYGEDTDGSTPIEFKRTNIINHLGQWKDKLYRDHLSNTKIRQALGTDVHRTITTKIKYITSGNVITTKDESGKPIYRSLTAIDSSDKIQLFIPNIQDDKKTLKNTRNSSDYIPKRTGISFGNPIYIGIKGRGTNETNQNIIPVPLKVNTIGGTLFESNNSKALIDEMMNLILKLGAARRANIEALRKNDTVGIETAHKTQNEIVDTLAKVVNIDYSDQGHKFAIISNNSTFKFKSKDEQGRDIFVIYDWHNNKDTFKYERDLGNNTVASGEISKEIFTEHLSKLSRTIEYKFFGKKFTDILGNVYDSYEDYLISTNTIITDVGAVYDSKGNKISHFMPKTDNAAAGLPLIINIDTSTIQSKAPVLTKFNKFLSEYQLDARYNFAFNFFNELTKGDVKFNGVSKARRKDPATGEYMLVYYDTTDKSINITPDWVDLYKNSPSSATLTLVHDIMHAVIGSRSKEEQAKLMSMLNEFRNDLLNTPEYKTLLQKADKTDIENKLITILNIKDPEEILTYGLTDTDFVKFLDTIKTTKNNITVSFWSRLKEIIREFAKTLGITGTKVDELNDMFNQFMEGKLIETKEETTDDGNLDFFKKHGGLGHNLKGVSFDSTLSVLNKEQVIEGLIIHWHEEGREILREELAKLDKDEFNEEAKRAGFYSLGNYWTVHTVANLKGVSFNSSAPTLSTDDLDKVNKIFTKFPQLAILFDNNKELYNEYLNNIFPNSITEFRGKLFFHGTTQPIENGKFKITDKSLAKGLWFTKQLSYAKLAEKNEPNGLTYGVVLNITNPKHFYNSSGAVLVQTPSKFYEQYNKTINDAAVFHHPNNNSFTNNGGYNQVVVFDSDKVHIIGDKNDLNKASEFIKDRTIKASSFSSKVNTEITGSPFTIEEEYNVLNLMSNVFSQIVADKYKDTKLKETVPNEVRTSIMQGISDLVSERIENGTIDKSKIPFLKRVILTIRDNDDFWKYFKIHLSSQYGYNLNEIDEFTEDIESLQKAWDQTEVFTKNTLSTVSDQVKNFINSIYEIDPLNITKDDDGNIIYNKNLNTPTGFANTLSVTQYINKIIDLMRDKLTKEDMLNALLEYADANDTIFAATCYSIHSELSANPEILNAWFTTFSKSIKESYQDLYKTINIEGNNQTEINLVLGTQNSVAYHIANEWVDNIIARAENNYYTTEFIQKWDDLFIETRKLALAGFSKINDDVIDNIIKLYDMVGIKIPRPIIMYNFRHDPSNFVANIITPILRIKGEPGKEDKDSKYIEQIVAGNTPIFNERGNLNRLADLVKYFREDHHNFSGLNTKGNLVTDIGNNSFLSNFFKKLDNAPEVVYDALFDYTKVISNQHSFLLWGDEYKDGVLNETNRGKGIFDYRIERGMKIPLDDKVSAINKTNLERFKYIRYSGSKDLNTNTGQEYSELSTFDWSLKKLIFYLGAGKVNREDTEHPVKESAVFSLLNPSDRKNTALFEVPIINVSNGDVINIVKSVNIKDFREVRNIPIFKSLYGTVIDELLAMQTAKELLFKLDQNGAIQFVDNEPVLNDDINPQLYYHYKIVDGKRCFLTFDENGNIDYEKSGNVFNPRTITISYANNEFNFNNFRFNHRNFIQTLINSKDLRTALYSQNIPDDPKSTFANRIEELVANFIFTQIQLAEKDYSVYTETLQGAYIKRDNRNVEEKEFIFKGTNPITAYTEYLLNSFLFGIEQMRLFYGSVADYKSNIDINKRGGEVLVSGVQSILTGFYSGATISDVKLKSRVYEHMVATVKSILGHDTISINVEKLSKVYTKKELRDNKIVVRGKEKTLFTDVEKEIYEITSPYLQNDSANATSFITFDEFVKRIDGFGLTTLYKDIIKKVKDGVKLDREELHKFASIQKNFYYSLDYNAELKKMVPTQVKNAEIVLTPALIKDLQLEVLNKVMIDNNISQVNLQSAEKVGSLYIGTINDKDGNILEESVVTNELLKAKRNYTYENLHMQNEVTDSGYEERITLGRQISKKIIANLPDDHEYNVNGNKIAGRDLKKVLFALQGSNIVESANTVTMPFGVRIFKDGNVKGEIDYNKIIDYLEKEGINRNLSKNLIYGLKIGNSGYANLPLCFNTSTQRWENILTSLFTNEVNTQKFAGIHVPQMSSLFMNRKKAVKQSDLTSTEGINWHLDMFSKLNPEGKEVKRNDIKLQSNILYDPKEGAKIIKAQVLLARWASEFYEKGTFEGADGKRYIDINTLPEDVRTMVGYRVPTEAKYSMYVFEVVGFLPDDNGPAIVLPDDFITQTDSDFDFDTVFALAYNLRTIKDAEGNTKIERVTYNIDSSEAGKKARIEEILRDRHALTYILSREYEIDDIIKDLNKLNQLVSEYIETNEYVKANFQAELNRIQELNAIIKESKGKDQNAISEKYELQARITTAPSNSEAYLYYKELPEYKKIYSKVETAIDGLDIEDQNTRKARENMIIDIYQAILTDPQHYLEQINPYKFKDITRVADEINSILNKDVSNINNLTVEGQNYYREKSIQGRSLKGISIALDRFNDIAQVAGIELTSHLREGKDVNPNVTLPTIKYKVPKTEVSRIKRDYKNDAVFEETKEGTFVTITHRYIANNPGNTYKNIIGKFINSYSAETTSNILDNVSNPLPENINSYTVSIWKMLVSLGSTYDVSTKFINQPIIRDLSDFFSKNINSVARGREIEEIKRKYQTLLYKVSLINGKEKNEYWDSSIAAGNSIKINGSPEIRDRQYRRLGYVNNKGITLTEDDLTNNLNAVTLVNGEYPELENLTDTTRAQQIEDFLRYQLQILETFRHYKAYSDAVTDGSNILNTDKIGAGPTFNTTSALLYAIERSNEIGILEIKGLSAMTAIFPKILNVPLESVYPTMEQYFIFSNWLSRSLFKEHFIGQSNVYQNIISRFNDYVTDKKLDSKLANTVTNYLNNLIISDLPWLNKYTLEDKRRILGINNKVDILLDITDTKDLDMISEFEKLSVANQIALLKTTNLYSEKHLFNYLDVMGNLSDLQIKKNGFHKIVYKNAELADTMTQSFNDIWYSDNVLERIVARNLLVYEYLTNGFGYGYESFSKIIPNTIYTYGEEAYEDGIDYNEKGIGLSEHFYGKLNKTNKIDFEEKKRDERDKEYHNAALTLFNTDYFEKFIRANWTNDSIVPDAGKLTYHDNEIQREDGGKGGNIRHFKLDEETGIISIPVETFDNIATSRIKEKVNSSNIIKLNSIKDGEVVWTLYKRTDSYVDVDDSGKRTGHFYYYPIAKLSHSENGDRSVFPVNNQLPNGSEILNEEEYNPIIAGLNKKDKVRDIIFKHSIAMNMTTNDGPFRPELSQYKTTLDLVRAGFRTATTRKESTHEAEKWALLKIGDYIKLQGTDEYIKVTKELHKIDLSNSIKAREEWSKLEGWDISYTHHKEDGIEFQDRDDLYQFEYIYIGTLEDVMEDANAEMSGDGTLDEIGVNETINTTIKIIPEISSIKPYPEGIRFIEDDSPSYQDRTAKNASADATIVFATNFLTRGEVRTAEEVEKQHKVYIPIDINDISDYILFKNVSNKNFIEENIITPIVKKLRKAKVKSLNIAGNGIYTLSNKFTQEQIDTFVYDILQRINTKYPISHIRTGGQTGVDEAGAKAGFRLGIPTQILAPHGYKFRVSKEVYESKYKGKSVFAYKVNKDGTVDISSEKLFKARFGINTDPQLDMFNNIKPSSYTSSIKPGVDFVFEQNPELAEIGSKELYSTYLSTIFPDSKVKKILYRGSEKGIQQESNPWLYFSDSQHDAYMYAKAHVSKSGNITERNPIRVITNNIVKKYNINNNVRLAITDTQSGIDELAYEGLISLNDAKEAKHLLETNEDIKKLVRLIHLYSFVKIESENDLMKQYDDTDYLKNKPEYDKLRKELDVFFNINEVGKLESVLLNITNPFDGGVQEDLLNNKEVYRNGHDGATLLDGEHFLIKNNKEQIHILGSQKDIEQFTNFVNLGIKPSSYTSSTSPSVNNAINSADQFTKKVYANLSNRVSRIKKEQVVGRKLSQLESTVKSLKELGIARDITELSLANLADALKVILGQFDFDLNRPKTDKDGGGIKIKLEEYINTDIQELINDPIKRKEFMNFMQRALSFLKGVRTFDTLESVDGEEYINEEKIINDLIRELQAMVPTINNVQTKYNNLLTKFYEADLRRFTSNPDILYGLRNIFDPSDDENYIQMQLDAMADTNNSFVALIVKKYTTLMTAADLESTKEIGDFEALLRKAFPGRNITDLSAADFYKYLEFKDGKPTARLIPKYDMDKYNAARDERMTYLAKKYGRTSQEFGRAARKWYEDNQVNNITPEELEEIIAKKKEDLPEWEFKDWKRRNMFTDTTNGKTYYKVADSNFATPSDKYINPAWTKVKDDPLYQKLVEIISNYTDHFGRATILNKGYIPTLTESDKDALSIREKWDKWVASKKYHQQSEQFVGENDEMVYILTVPMVEYFTQEEEIKISPRNKDELSKDYERRVIQEVREAGKGSFKSYEEIIAKNREIRKANDEYHAGKINYNLYEVFSKFIREANRYKAKANMKRDVDLALYQNEISLFNKRDSRNRLLRNKTAGKALEKDVTGLTTGKGTNLEKHFAEWLEAVFYGNFDIDEGDWTKISKMLLQYTSAKNMWFNLTAGISNVAMGKLQIKLESNAGWYLKKENLNKADKMYIAAIPDMISNLGSTKSKSLIGAIIKLLDIAQNTNERDYTTGMLKKQLLSWSSAYFINDMGEHYMQNVNALAMMDHARIINGKIYSLADFSYKNYREALETILNPVEKEELARYEKVRYEREEFKQSKKDYLRDYILALPIEKRTAFVEAKKQIDATVTKDFETYPKVIDAFYLDNSGYAKLRDEIEVDGKKLNTKLTDQELAGFISKIKYVVRKQQGYYNQEDAGMVQRRGIGKMLIQFRKYMRPGWNKRFGSKFGKSYWTESRDEWDKGTYVSLLHFLGTPIKKAKVENLNEAKTFYSMMGRILSDYGKMVTGTSLYWSTLDDFEKANIRRATSEMLYLSAVILAGFLLKKLKPEDDDDEFFAYDLTVYEIDRLMSELMMYTPIGLINEGQKILRSPAAVQGTMLDTYKLLTSLVSYPFQSDEARRYKTNIYSGDLKVKVNTIKMLPILNKLQQMKRLDKFNKYYILFRG